MAGDKSTILHTSDGGKTWQVQIGGDPGATDDDLMKIFVLDAQHGWAMTGSGKILGTRDGKTWAELSTVSGTSKGVWFVSPQTGFEIENPSSTTQTTLRRSDDGGKTWPGRPHQGRRVRGVRSRGHPALSPSASTWAFDDLDAFLKPVAELRLSSGVLDCLPCKLEDGRGRVLVSPQQWSAILVDCVQRAGDRDGEFQSLVDASLHIALGTANIDLRDVTDPRVIEAQQIVAAAPEFLRNSPLPLEDRHVLALCVSCAESEGDVALQAARQASQMLERARAALSSDGLARADNRERRFLRSLTPRWAFETGLARLREERADLEGRRLIAEPQRLVSALVHQLCSTKAFPDVVGEVGGPQVRDVMAERLGRLPVPELQLLGAAVLGLNGGIEAWTDAVRAHGTEPREEEHIA